jgi:hypothetical protein
MGIAGDKPRQLAPTVGTTGSGSTDSPAPSPTTTKIDIDTVIGIAVPTDTTTKIDIDTVVGIAVPADVTTKIDIDTIVGIAVPAVINANSTEPGVDAADSIVVSNVSPSAAKLTPAANVIDPISSATGAAFGGYDMAFGLFNFHVDSNGAMELLSIGESAPLMAKATTPSVVGGKPSTGALLAPSEEEPKLKTSTPSVGSNDFKELHHIREATVMDIDPPAQQNAPELSFDATKDTGEHQIHLMDPTKTARVSNSLSPA